MRHHGHRQKIGFWGACVGKTDGNCYLLLAGGAGPGARDSIIKGIIAMTGNLRASAKSKTRTLTPLMGGVAAVLLIAGGTVGVMSYNAHTEQLCANAAAARDTSAALEASSVAKSIRAQGLVDGTANYGQSAEEAALINEHKAAFSEVNYDGAIECSSQAAARAIESQAVQADLRSTRLDEAATKLSAHVIAFQETEKAVSVAK